MTLIMGDAVGASAGSIPASVQAVAGYITGLGVVPWPPSAWDLFPGIPHYTIDQGAGASPNYAADIIDIETGAYDVSHVPGWLKQATKPRPMIYVNRGNEQDAVNAALTVRPTIDIWLAFPGWTLGTPLPKLPAGGNYVAIQDVFAGSYDLSTIIDKTWPAQKGNDPMNGYVVPGIDGIWLFPPTLNIGANGDGFCYGFGMDGNLWLAKRPAGQPWGNPAPL